MDKYIVRSFEHQYEGLYGMESYLVVEDDLKEVEETARDESYAIMENYSCIIESLEAEAEFEDSIDAVYENNVAYNIWTICYDCPLSQQQIDKMIIDDPETFIEKYCTLIISR